MKQDILLFKSWMKLNKNEKDLCAKINSTSYIIQKIQKRVSDISVESYNYHY
jgi:hypothetical protein